MLQTTIRFQLRNYFLFFGNMTRVANKLLSNHVLSLTKFQKTSPLTRKKIMLCCLIWEEKQKKKRKKNTQILKYNFYNFILTVYGPTTANSSPYCCTSQQYLFISSGYCCCCFKLSSKQLLPFCHIFRVTNTKAPPIYFSLFTTSKGISRANLSAIGIISLAIWHIHVIVTVCKYLPKIPKAQLH